MPRRRIVALAALSAAVGLGAWLFTRLGWPRLQSQLAAQVTYEDQRARAGDVTAVLALQASGQTDWREQVVARARLGLAAPLPAGDLLPSGAPPRLSRLDAVSNDLFDATVTRDYADSSGQTYAFDLVQRYRNISPGAWERLAPDEGLVNNTTLFQGQRLAVMVPTADLPWLGPALLKADDLIDQACADWGNACPAGLRLAASFGAAQELSDPIVTADQLRDTQYALRTTTDHAPRTTAFPRIFFLPVTPAPGRLLGYALSAPLLAGRLHDAAAQAALSRSISVQLLAAFAGEVSGSARTDDDYFLDALVARVEVRRLGASAAPQPITPQDHLPLRLLWRSSVGWNVADQSRLPGGWRTDLAARREAFDFLNFALAGQPASVDGKLLLSLRRGFGQSVDDWLASAVSSAPPAESWTQQTMDKFASHAVADWSQYEGLVLACGDGVYQVQGGSPRLLLSPPQIPEIAVSVGSLSPDGHYLDYYNHSIIVPAEGVTNSAPSPWTVMMALDLVTGDYHWVYEAPQVQALGWSPSDDLIYAIRNTQNNETDSAQALQLRVYHADAGIGETIIPDRVDPYAFGPNAWSADHSALLLGLAEEVPRGQFTTSLALLTFAPTVQLHRLYQAGDAAALSPDGQRLAFIKFAEPAGATAGISPGINRLNVFELATGDVTTIAATDNFGLPTGVTNFWGLQWSADGARLAWRAHQIGQGDYLLTAPARGGALRVWAGAARRQLFALNFSPDGRYLAAVIQEDMMPQAIMPPDQFWLFDQQGALVQPPLTSWATSIVWSPEGHRLVMAGAPGVSALDPATGQYEWLGTWQNCQLRW